MPEILKNEKVDQQMSNMENSITVSVFSNNVKNYIHEIKFKTHHKPRRKKFCCLCRSQTNSLLLILGVYVTIFSIASIILVMSLLKLPNLNGNSGNNFSTKSSEERSIYSSSLKEIDSIFARRFFKEFMWPFKSSDFNCSSLSHVKKVNYLTSGWTKDVYSFEYDGKHYAFKTVNVQGVDMTKCTELHPWNVCFEKASSKMYKEYILSKELSHSNIIKVLAWCVTNSDLVNEVAVVTELCSPIDIVTLLRMTFPQRLKVMMDLSRLLTYLTESPLGSVAINDFQRQQFVLCGNTLKLTDLDDLSIEEPKCRDSTQCSQKKLIENLKLNESNTKSHGNNCVNNICVGYNEKHNVINAYKHFVNLFLNISAPDALKDDVEAVLDSYISTWNAKVVLKQTELLNGKYKKLKNSDKNKL